MEAEVKIKKKDGITETVKYGPQEKYDAQNTVQIKLKLNKKTDADILDWLNSLDNKQGAIKEAIRDRIEAAKITQRYYADPDKVIPALKVKGWLRSTGGNNCCEEHEEYHDILFDETLDEAKKEEIIRHIIKACEKNTNE